MFSKLHLILDREKYSLSIGVSYVEIPVVVTEILLFHQSYPISPVSILKKWLLFNNEKNNAMTVWSKLYIRTCGNRFKNPNLDILSVTDHVQPSALKKTLTCIFTNVLINYEIKLILRVSHFLPTKHF